MTRVEKYAEYRKEIENSFRDKTTKEVSSKRVEKMIKENRMTSNKINYDDVLEAYDIYDTGVQEEKRKSKISKKQIIFVMIYSVIIIALIASLIIVGIQAFGGK